MTTLGKNELVRLKRFAGVVGDFMRYWGFRRIHGQVWAEIYLSRKPLSLTELTQLLGVSKALVSPALTELVDYGLIRHVGGDRKTRTYAAEDDVLSVIRTVLRKRELILIERAAKEHRILASVVERNGESAIDAKRLEALGGMISSASFGLNLLLAETGDDLGGLDRFKSKGKRT